MAESDTTVKNGSNQIFDDYMMDALRSSIDWVEETRQKNQQAISYFLTLLTALVGGGVVVVTTITDEFLKLSILTLDFGLIAGFGTLVYIWMLAFITQTKQESYLQFFLHKYFRDKDPDSFTKYGLSKLLVSYRKTYDEKSSPSLSLSTSVSLLVLPVFSACLIACAGYTGWRVFTRKENILFAIIIGIVYLAVMTFIGLRTRKRIFKLYDEGLEIFKAYHSN